MDKFMTQCFLVQADKGRRGTVSNGQASVNPGISKKETIPEEKLGAVGGTNRDSDDDDEDDDDD